MPIIKSTGTVRDLNSREQGRYEKSKIKEMTIAEASDFFDEHDIFEFEDVKKVTDIKFDLKKKKYIGVDAELYKKIKSKAKKLHTDEDSLIKKWLQEKAG